MNPKLDSNDQHHFVGALDKMAVENGAYRKVIFTGKHIQLVLMNLGPEEEVEREVHLGVDQFFRVERGMINVYVENPDEVLEAREGDAIIVPAGTYHRVVAGTDGASFYTIYGPPNHPNDEIQN